MVYPWAVSDSDLGTLHKHCYKCFHPGRCKGGGDSCPIIDCNLGCKSRFHQCKESEHKLLCGKEWVPCLNVTYGCDAEIQRCQITKHLPVCPANVVACTQEWNRWPMFCKERYKTIPFRRKNPIAKSGDLDLELTIRDARMVGDFLKVPRKTKLALRNNLTRRYPALPLPQTTPRKPDMQDRTFRTLKDIVKFEVGENESVGPQYGVARLFLKQQEIQKRRWQEDVDKAIERTGQPVPKKYWEFEELEKGNIHAHCAHCVQSNCNVRSKDHESEYDLTSCAVVECPSECGFKMHHCKAFEHRMICANFEEEGEFDWILRDRIVKKKKAVIAKPLKPFPDLFEAPAASTTLSTTSAVQRRSIPPPPPPPNDIQRVLRFDIRLETVTRLQQKPKAMYTFLCGQDLRRDQWESHSRNVHNDIHGGLNNWMVARCPLASYGCGFSFNRLYPGSDPGNKVVFSHSSDSFGVSPANPGIKSSKKKSSVTLSDLPVELVQMIIGHLDSWSLNQLALVSRYLREVVSTLLDAKGCVSLQWERTGDGLYNKKGWCVAYKRWFFSTHFEPIKTWGFNMDGLISEHLKSCPYNDRVVLRTPDKKSKESKELMKALNAKIKMKRDSEWFIS